MSTIFESPEWEKFSPYARLSVGRDNLDLLQLPDDLRSLAVRILRPCVACGNLVRVFRARMKSKRSRIANQVEERRLFYAASCPSDVNAGCARSKAAQDHKKRVRDLLGKQRDRVPSISVEVRDASGMTLYCMSSEVRESFQVDIPAGATTIAFLSEGV